MPHNKKLWSPILNAKFTLYDKVLQIYKTDIYLWLFLKLMSMNKHAFCPSYSKQDKCNYKNNFVLVQTYLCI